MTLPEADCYNAPLALFTFWRTPIYAIVETGGKQYIVTPGQKLKVDLLGVPSGNRIEMNRVLLIADDGKVLIGRPLVEGAKVIASCMAEAKDRKVIAFKYHRKNRYRRKIGHRQPYTELTVRHILKPGETEPEAPVVPEPEKKAPEAAEAAIKPVAEKAKKPKAKVPVKKAAPKVRTAEAPKPKAVKTEKKTAKPKATPKKPAAEAPKPKITRKKTSPKAEEK